VELYLEECVRSIQRQTLRDIEIILIDDGSPDRCPQMCDRFGQEDERIRVFHQANQGVSSARNLGLEMAVGDWIAFADPDDWIEDDALEIMLTMAQETSCDMVAGFHFTNWTNTQIDWRTDQTKGGFYPMDQYRNLFDCLVLCKLCTSYGQKYQDEDFPSVRSVWGKLFNRAFISSNGIRFSPDLKFGEDIEFMLHVINAARSIAVCPKPLYHVRNRLSSATHQVNSIAISLRFHWIEKLDFLAYQLNFSDTTKQYVRISIVKMIFAALNLCGTQSHNEECSCFDLVGEVASYVKNSPACTAAIHQVSYLSMLHFKDKLRLFFLKHNMYAAVALLIFIYYHIFPPKNFRDAYP